MEFTSRTFKDILEKHDNIFGRKTVLLGGDFRQTLPIVTRGTRNDVVNASINKSYLWEQCRVFLLNKNMRLSSNEMSSVRRNEIAEFGEWVLQLGEGRILMIALSENEEPQWIEIPPEILLEPGKKPIEEIIKSTYPNLDSEYANIDYMKDRCILTPMNDDVEEVNATVMSQIPTTAKVYRSADSLSQMSGYTEEQEMLHPVEYLNTLKASGIPNHLIELKIGVPVMLTRNIDPSNGLCNGTRLIILEMKSKTLHAQIVTGSHVGKKVTIHRIITTSRPTQWEFMLRRIQFPIKMCFAMTINKSQGQTLNHVGIYLPRPTFSHGQLYVAVSRVTSKRGLKIMIARKEEEPAGYTRNIVYREVFTDLPTGDAEDATNNTNG
ncbi:DNA helicase [Ranunculus cassubicifolius]